MELDNEIENAKYKMKSKNKKVKRFDDISIIDRIGHILILPCTKKEMDITKKINHSEEKVSDEYENIKVMENGIYNPLL